MVMETMTNVISSLGASDIDERLEVRLIDGIIYAFQEQTTEDQVMLDGFGTVVNALGVRVKPYLTQIVSTVLWRLGNKSAKVRQQAADLTTRLAVVIKQCGEDQLLSKVSATFWLCVYTEVLSAGSCSIRAAGRRVSRYLRKVCLFLCLLHPKV
jgi:splicing factor 3B subunit 1